MTGVDDDSVTGRITIGDRVVPFRVRYGDVTHARLTIDPDGAVRVRAPQDMEDTERLLTDNRQWIERRLDAKTAAAKECGVGPGEGGPVLFGREHVLEQDAAHTEIGMKEDTLEMPKGTELSDPTLEEWVTDLLREELDAVMPDVAAVLDVPVEETRLDSSLKDWSDHTKTGTILVHPRAAILPLDLLKQLIFRELVFYKEEVNNRSYWGDMIERYPDYTVVRDRLLGYWLLSHASNFWNSLVGPD